VRGAERDDDAEATRSPKPGTPAGPSAKPPDEQTLLQELWQISHLGWISETAILRSLTIAGGQEIPGDALAERLRQLLERGWAEQRPSDAGKRAREWRLTDSGRNAR
jgi:hypothetical protein